MKTLTVHNKIPARILKRNKMIFKNVFLGCSLAALTFLFLFFSPQSKAASSGKVVGLFICQADSAKASC